MNGSGLSLRYAERKAGSGTIVRRTAAGWSLRDVCAGRGCRFRPVEMIAEYVKLCQQGDETFSSRRDLLKSARSQILKQIEKYQTELQRLEYKISRYEAAVETGNLVWDEPDGRNTCEAHG